MIKRSKKVIYVTLAIIVGLFIILNLLKFAGSRVEKKIGVNNPRFFNSFHNVSDSKPLLKFLPTCSDKKEFFNTAPLSLNDYINLDPLGGVSPPSHIFPIDHMYFHIDLININNPQSKVRQVPIKSPGDVWVTGIWGSEYGNSEYQDDYTVILQPCQELELHFFHVTKLSDKLKQAYKAPFDECRNYSTGGWDIKHCEKSVKVKVSAGEIIGMAGGGNRSALDIGTYDRRIKPHIYANQKRWYSDKPQHVTCPLDYFTSVAKKEMYSKLGGYDDNGKLKLRTTEPVCGQVALDVPKTAQGVWFLENTKETYPEDSHLALVPYNFFPNKQLFSIGISFAKFNMKPEVYLFEPKKRGSVNINFKQVKADGNIYCYEIQKRFDKGNKHIMIISMTSPNKLKVERLNINSCNIKPLNFSKKAILFER